MGFRDFLMGLPLSRHPGLRDGFQETVSECRQFLGSQVFVTESCYWLTGPIKTAKNAHNTGSCAWRELAAAAWVLPFRGENAGHTAPALRLSLRHSPLVNSAPQRRRSSVEGGSTYVVVGETWCALSSALIRRVEVPLALG